MYSVTFDHRRARGGSSGGGEIVRHGHGLTHLQCNMLRRPDGVMKEKQTHTHKHIHTHAHKRCSVGSRMVEERLERAREDRLDRRRDDVSTMGSMYGCAYMHTPTHTPIHPSTRAFIHPPTQSCIQLPIHPPTHPSIRKNINAIHLHSCSYTIHLHHSFAPCMD